VGLGLDEWLVVGFERPEKFGLLTLGTDVAVVVGEAVELLFAPATRGGVDNLRWVADALSLSSDVELALAEMVGSIACLLVLATNVCHRR
jgi:hypothetical protein